jgi:hypothetical protein
MGRGEYYRWNAKTSTASLLCVRLADLKKHNCLTLGWMNVLHWSRNGERVASVRFTVTSTSITFMYSIKDGEGKPLDVNKTIPLTWTPCYFGGHRK